ncbi:hypothetical protein [Candidatus Thiosymbion oneisti]|uniref:hypothetical protein n=1 Tax=Candidatus Thiosymbion oneisti TaxID=589554 RepID=UPI000B7DDC36|nr:hypothetical protein [Candidatus Thiosymbion oneisti]
MRVYFDIQTQGTSAYACTGAGGEMLRLDGLQLGEQAQVRIKGKHYTLGDLVRLLIEFKNNRAELLDDRDQLEIGRYLYAQTIARLLPAEQNRLRDAPEVILHLTSPDEQITRLPWVLLARDQDLLSTCGWSVLLSGVPFARPDDQGTMQLHHGLQAAELPPAPRLLVIAPQPQDLTDTDADAHLETLQGQLSSGDARLVWDKHLRRVSEWEEFVAVLPEFRPHLIYYYGHGIGSKHRADLVFADARGKRKDVPVTDFAQCISRLEDPPRLVYVNCCQGDAAGYLGVGRQIKAPAVLTNRTKAVIPAAQEQAMALWEAVILQGQAPHLALQAIYQRTAELKLSRADVRWMTPVLYGHYDHWRAHPPTPAKHWIKDDEWHLKVDRIHQFATVSFLVREMLRNRRPRCLFFVWYGRAGEGIDLFHERLASELELDLPGATEVYTVNPAWPDQLANSEIAFREVTLEAFRVNSLEDIPARIRTQNQGERQVLTYLNHRPVITRPYTSSEMLKNTINPQTLRDYFDWCDRVYPSLLEPGQYLLIGISFVVKDPPKFRDWFRRAQSGSNLHDSVVRLLDEMENLAEEDLLDFLHLHDIPLPASRRDQVIKSILTKTKGHYELTIAELESWLECGLAVEEEQQEDQGFTPFEV